MYKTDVYLKQSSSGWRKIIFAAIVAFVTLVVYLPALQNGFVNWDDNVYVYENPNIQSIDYGLIKRCLISKTIELWHPLSCLSFALDYAVWELNPFGYHLINIIYHALNTFLVYILVLRLTAGNNDQSKRNILVSFLTALFFGIHPLRVESVAWISERKDVLSTFFFLLSILSYLKHISSPHKRLNYLACLIFFALALMSKPMAVSLPVVLLILDFYPLNRLTRAGGAIKFVLIEKFPFFLVSLISSVITIWAGSAGDTLSNLETSSLTLRAFVAMRSYIFYIFKIGLPVNLAPFYPYPPKIVPFSLEYLIPVILMIGITSVCLLLRNKGFFAIWAYYLIALLPVSGIIMVGNVAVADRYTYLPSIGPFLLASLGIAALSGKYPARRYRLVLITVLLLILSILGFKTVRQISIWKDSNSLWSYEIKLFSDVEIAYNNRGVAYREIRDRQLAIKDFDTAIKLNPKYTEPYYNRGNAHNSLGNYQQAIKDFSKAIGLNPPLTRLISAYKSRGIAYRSSDLYKEAIRDFDTAIKLDPEYQKAYNNRGITYMILNEYQEAIKDLSMVIKLNPGDADTYNLRGAAYVNAGSYQQAIEDLDTAVKLKPGFEEAYYNRGTAYRILGDNYKAVNDFSMAISLNPQYAEAYNNRGNAYRDLGNYHQAIEDYSIAVKLNPQDAIAYRNRGIAYKNLGNNEQSVKDFNKADELALR